MCVRLEKRNFMIARFGFPPTKTGALCAARATDFGARVVAPTVKGIHAKAATHLLRVCASELRIWVIFISMRVAGVRNTAGNSTRTFRS